MHSQKEIRPKSRICSRNHFQRLSEHYSDPPNLSSFIESSKSISHSALTFTNLFPNTTDEIARWYSDLYLCELSGSELDETWYIYEAIECNILSCIFFFLFIIKPWSCNAPAKRNEEKKRYIKKFIRKISYFPVDM